MKKYIVKYKQHEIEFDNIHEATKEAEKIGETGANVYVYSEVDGVREEDYFYSCTWEI